MTTPQTVSIRLTDEKVLALNAIATQQNHSRNAVMNEAIDHYLDMYQAWVEGIEAALVEVEAGNTSPAAEVFERIRGKYWKSN